MELVLFEPEIPQNTGNIARICACTGAKLHLVKPFKFEITDAKLKRAGLDYWDKVGVVYYDNFDDFLSKNKNADMYFIETGTDKRYCDVSYPKGAYLIVGQETKGVPKELLARYAERVVTIPMKSNVRSHNVANCVAIVLYEALRQHGFSF